jgi:cell division protein FtsL
VSRFHLILRWLAGAGLAVAAVWLALLSVPKYNQRRQLALQRDALRRSIEAKQNDLREAKRKQQRYRTDPAFVEHVARQNLRVRPGEVVFITDPSR